ncbi:carbohydrate sulfotransferase 12-like [Antennarius striatus]|uniref:carbohydrate sulfotransferase 12-like n=1 Tax=Antennarius striatus TaxID=241820 RepID=UPI0035B15415
MKGHSPEWNHTIDDLSDKDLQNFLVDDEHQVIYCFIPKVACTNWKRFMIVLKHGKPYQDLMSYDFDMVHFGSLLTHLKTFPRTEVKKKLKEYRKFLFVRDPFVRLISAYRDKLQRYQKWYYETYGKLILRKYGNMPNPPRTKEEMIASGVHPSFHSFIKYVIDPGTKSLDYHWRQMHRICHPCTIQYDFTGHQETLHEDSEQLLKMLNLENDIKFPSAYPNVTTSNFVPDWFKTVSLKERRKLYEIYKMDFKLFGYPKPIELLGD